MKCRRQAADWLCMEKRTVNENPVSAPPILLSNLETSEFFILPGFRHPPQFTRASARWGSFCRVTSGVRDGRCRVGVSRPCCSPLRVIGDTDGCVIFLNEIAVFPCDVGVCMIRAHSPRHKLISARRAVFPAAGAGACVSCTLSAVIVLAGASGENFVK